MNWSDFTTALYTMLQIQDVSGQANFNLILPRMMDDAELFLFQHPRLDFLATRTTDRSQTTTPGSRSVMIPTAFIVVEDFALITPAGAMPDTVGAQRIPFVRATRQWIDFTWPQESQTQAPSQMFDNYWAVYTEQEGATPGATVTPQAGAQALPSSVVLRPTPDSSYVAEFRGTFRPQRFDIVAGFVPTSGFAANPGATTFLSTYMPHLLLAATMLISTAYQRLWGAASDDPKMAMSWQAHLEMLIDGASVEELRKKQVVGGWSAYPPNPTMIDFTPPPPAAAVPQGR